MKITLTPNNKASLTAQTVNGPVTIQLRDNCRMPSGAWRKFASHSVRPRFQPLSNGNSQKIF